MNLITPNEFFDEIICLNLPRAFERWHTISAKLKKHNIYVTRLEGVDRKDSTTNSEYLQHLRNNPTTILRKPGRYAIWRAFCKVFEYILSYDNIKTFLIFEDDILFHKDFKSLFDAHTKKLPDNWDMWYLGVTQLKWDNIDRENIKFFFKPNGHTYGMFAAGMKRSFLEKNYKQYKLGLKNNDHYFATEIDFTNVYASYPSLIGHDLGWSYNAEYVINENITNKLNYLKYDMNIYE